MADHAEAVSVEPALTRPQGRLSLRASEAEAAVAEGEVRNAAAGHL